MDCSDHDPPARELAERLGAVIARWETRARAALPPADRQLHIAEALHLLTTRFPRSREPLMLLLEDMPGVPHRARR
ncbi:hypothetical protein ACMT1E_10015 [Sphingomonas flavalba]|uniref:hypothetical protein n=1 Tax=Sphingomonas flavalba TaxID=2559804 RepID=UPI0039E06FD4